MALPEYVTRKRKPNGREYYFYQRHRGTDDAWPILRLPPYYDLAEFAKRHAQYCRLSFDRGLWHYTCTSGKVHQIPVDNPRDYLALWELLDKCDAAGQLAAAYDGKGFFALADAYRQSDDYRQLKAKTKKDYDRYLGYITEVWGDLPVASLNAVVAQDAVDSMKDTPAAARKFRAFFRTFIEWGIPRGFHTSNPVSHTKAPKGGEPYPAWPDWAFETFFKHARPDAFGIVFSALYTGQRQGDVITMPRIHSQATEISLRTEKVGLNLTIPMHPEYQQLLKLYPSNASTSLHLMADGRPWTVAGFRTYWQRMRSQPEFSRFKSERIVFHGLRKNAVCLLAEAGALDTEISAIVGMSLKMVQHYSRDVKMKILARNCFKRVSGEWDSVMPATLPRAGQLATLGTRAPKLGTANKSRK